MSTCGSDIKQDKGTFTEVDMGKQWIIKNSDLKTKCGWTPFNGWKVRGKIINVYLKGRKVFENGELLVKPRKQHDS